MMIAIIHSLLGGSGLIFAFDESFNHHIEVLRGLPQGAATTALLFMLAYQPFLDMWEASCSGITITLNGRKQHLLSASHAGNSLFFLGNLQDLDIMTKL